MNGAKFKQMGGMCFPRGYIRLNRLQGGRPFKTALAAACALKSRNITHNAPNYTALIRQIGFSQSSPA
jgi:hypothetical protein